MSAASVALILAAAFCHAGWNVIVKRTGAGGPLFLWLAAVLSAILWLPLALVALVRSDVGFATVAGAVAVSGTFHLTYFLSLQAGYRAGDLSVVYPLARGTGPAVAVLAAVVLRGERPSAVAIAGAAIVVAGLLSLAMGSAVRSGPAIAFGVLTGIVIAGYTLWDKYAVADLAVAAIVLSWGTEAMRAVLLTPLAIGRRAVLAAFAREHGKDALAFAVLSPLAYILVLVALRTTDVSFIAPAREVSIVIGVVLGRVVLHEVVTRQRLASAAVVALGVMLLALG
jgi:drug/metabolite transporter (DMT)-like permease